MSQPAAPAVAQMVRSSSDAPSRWEKRRSRLEPCSFPIVKSWIILYGSIQGVDGTVCRADNDVTMITLILTSPATGQPQTSKESALAVAGKGLDGDRYATGKGFYTGDTQWDAHVT